MRHSRAVSCVSEILIDAKIMIALLSLVDTSYLSYVPLGFSP